jgi:hypothetical protein
MKRILSVLCILLCSSLTLHAQVILTAGAGNLPLTINYNGHPYGSATTGMSVVIDGGAFSLDAIVPLGDSRLGLYGTLHLGSGDYVYIQPSGENDFGTDKDKGGIIDLKAGTGWFFAKTDHWIGFAGMSLAAHFMKYNYTYFDFDLGYNRLITMEEFMLGFSDTIQLYYFFTKRYGIMAAADYTLLFVPVKFKVANDDIWYDLAGSFENARSFNIRLGITHIF